MIDHAHEISYTGTLYVRPVGRGIVLHDAKGRPHIEDWVEQALRHPGVLHDGDEWLTGGRMTEPVTITIRIERPPAP